MSLRRLLKVIPIIAILPIGMLLMFIGAFTSIVPSGSPNTMKAYMDISANAFYQIHWEDPYILDYFRRQNNFGNITPNEIQATVNLFYRIYYDADGNIVKVPISLYDVMMSHGYSMDDYNAALQLESLVDDEMQSIGGTLNGPMKPVSVKELAYKPVSDELLYEYVHQRGSVFTLSDIDMIMRAAQRYDVSATLLVAITGQEQGFCPASSPYAHEMELNPFNVEGPGQSGAGSWETWHVSLQEAADIAAGTLHNKLVFPPPAGENAVDWINDPTNPYGIYATDHGWSYGVDDIFQSINAYINAGS